MSNSDGQVRIIIDINAKETVKALDDTSKAFNKTGKSAENVTTVFNSLQNGVNKNIEALREMALGGGQNSKEFQKLAQQTREYKKALEEANQAVEKSISITNNTVQSTSKSFMDLEVAGIKVGSALKGITYIAVAKKLYDIGQQALKTAAQFEQLEVSFKIMTGGAAQGEKLTQSLVNLANKTPMTTETLARASQTLLSFGESADSIVDDLKLIGDISGGQADRFQSLALAFAQVGSTGRLTGQDLLQMVNQGFNPLQIMSEKTAKSMAELKKEMGEGKISFDMVKQAMIDATSEGGRFYGLMNEQSKTLNGLLSTNADIWQKVSDNIGKSFMPVVKEAVRVLIALGNAILSLQRKMNEFQKQFNYKTSDSAIQKAESMFKEAQKYRELAAREEERAAKWQGKRPIEGMLARAESYKKHAIELEAAAQRFKKSAQEIKNAENTTANKNNSGGFSSGISNIVPSSNVVSIQQAKSKQEAVKAETAKIIEQKGAYQLLNEKVSELTAKLRDLAAEQQIGSADWVQYKQDLTKAQTELDNVNKSLQDNGINIEETSKKISSSLSSGLVSALRSGGNAFDMFSNIATTALQRILDKLLEMSVITPLLNAFSGGFGGSLLSFFGFKNGAAFKNGNVIPFASGGVVNKPTLFPMANGGTGVMGEAGAEAVMPLKRMSNGKLGVEADGQGGQVVNIYNYSGASVETRKRDDNSVDVFIRRVNDALSNERTSSGFRSAYSRENNKGVQAV